MNTAGGARRLYKSRTSRMIDGVCGGVAEYFGIDPTLVRITWVLLTLLGGSGVLLYIAGMIVMPKNPDIFASPDQRPDTSASPSSHRFWGVLLVVTGALWLMGNLGIWHRWWGFSWDLLLPTLLVLAGVGFLLGGRSYVSYQQPVAASDPGGRSADPTPGAPHPASTPTARLYRSRLERKLFGVCGGLGAHFGVDPTIVRVLFVISAIASCGLTIFAYFLFVILVPDEPLSFSA